MEHQDHVNLVRNGIGKPGGVWADFGSGSGAFTLALADLLGSSAHIYSIDQDPQTLREQSRTMHTRFPAVTVEYLTADFTQKLTLPPLDGILMANSLHFVRNKGPVLDFMHSYLRPQGRFILVEYNADRGNWWVPYSLSYQKWEELSCQHGFNQTRLLATVPSRFLGEIYSALSLIE